MIVSDVQDKDEAKLPDVPVTTEDIEVLGMDDEDDASFPGEASNGSDAGNRMLDTFGDGCVFGSKDGRFDFKGSVKGLQIYTAALTSEQIKYLKGFISGV